MYVLLELLDVIQCYVSLVVSDLEVALVAYLVFLLVRFREAEVVLPASVTHSAPTAATMMPAGFGQSSQFLLYWFVTRKARIGFLIVIGVRQGVLLRQPFEALFLPVQLAPWPVPQGSCCQGGARRGVERGHTVHLGALMPRKYVHRCRR